MNFKKPDGSRDGYNDGQVLVCFAKVDVAINHSLVRGPMPVIMTQWSRYKNVIHYESLN